MAGLACSSQASEWRTLAAAKHIGDALGIHVLFQPEQFSPAKLEQEVVFVSVGLAGNVFPFTGRFHGDLVTFTHHAQCRKFQSLGKNIEYSSGGRCNLLPGKNTGDKRVAHGLHAAVCGIGVDDEINIAPVQGIEESRDDRLVGFTVIHIHGRSPVHMWMQIFRRLPWRAGI